MAGNKLYFGIWLILIVATLLEVATRSLPGSTSILVSIIVAIASIKAILIALYYQHLRYEGRTLAVGPLAGIVALIALAITAVISLGM
jgi:cytochrome c oxidase subunit IV